MFCDKTKIKFIAGKGGDGCSGFRREKFIAKGGPDGGDGGNGGDIILIADPNINTLAEFNTKKTYRAEKGEQGKGKNMHGKNGEDLILKVPMGTVIYDLGKGLIADLSAEGSKCKIVKGGQGGLGNARFKTSIFRAPTFAEIGEPGEETEVTLELKLVADVGIIGMPNAGKSTLISHISNAKPKIANYPFTTLVPNLGVVNNKFIVADIPGLIEGAHAGKGLGHDFLRHVSRTRVLIHVLDGTDPGYKENYKKIQNELKKYDADLAKRPQLIVINKSDAIPSPIRFKKALNISAVSGENLDKLIHETERLLKAEKNEPIVEKTIDHKIFKPHTEKQRIEIIKKGKQFIVKGKRIEQMAIMTDFNNRQGLQRLYNYLNVCGAERALKRAGAREGDIVNIMEKEIKFTEWKN